MDGLTENYCETGAALLLSQFHHSPNLSALLDALLTPYRAAQDALSALLTERHPNTAGGKQLDGIGDIVGMARPYVSVSGQWYFGFTGQSKAKGFSQAPIRDVGLNANNTDYVYMSDAAYQRLLHWKIAANSSHGTVEDLISAAKALYLATKVTVQNSGKGAVKITITALKKYQISAFDDRPERWMPTAAGVRATILIHYT